MHQYLMYFAMYLVLANLVGFGLMAWDKRRAIQNGWRVQEKTLLGSAVVGGSLGVYAGMRLLRHKTLHWYFAWGVPAIIVAQAGLLFWVLRRG